MMYNIRSDAIRWQMLEFLSDGSSNFRSISDRLRDKHKTRKNAETDLENEIQGQE